MNLKMSLVQQIYIKDMNDFTKINGVYDKYLGEVNLQELVQKLLDYLKMLKLKLELQLLDRGI